MNSKIFFLLLIMLAANVFASEIDKVQVEISPSLYRPEIITGQHLEININVSDRETPSVSEISQISQDNKVYISQRLMIRVEEHNISDSFASKLMGKKDADDNAFEGILRLTATIMEKPEDKEIFAGELADMDDRFVAFFCGMPLEKQPMQKMQAVDYVNTVQTGLPIGVKIEDRDVEDLYKKKTSLDTLMEHIWISLDK